MNKNNRIAFFLLGWIQEHYNHKNEQHEATDTSSNKCVACNAYEAALKEYNENNNIKNYVERTKND